MEMLFSKLCLALILFISYVKTQIPLKCSNEEKCLIKFEDYLSNNVGRIIYQENIQKDYEKKEIHKIRGYGFIYEENKPVYIYDIYKVKDSDLHSEEKFLEESLFNFWIKATQFSNEVNEGK